MRLVSAILSTAHLCGLARGFELLYKDKSDSVTEFSFESFQNSVLLDESPVNWVIVFYADWCGHCKVFAPNFIELAESVNGSENLKFGAVDCAADIMTKIESEDICRVFDIKSYPTIRLFRHGQNDRALPHVMDDLRNSLLSMLRL